MDDTTPLCPCCGQQVDPTEILVSLDTNMICYRGRTVKLTPIGAEICYALARPLPTRAEQLIAAVWGVNEPQAAAHVLHVHMHQLRRRLAPIGLTIKNYTDRGYHLLVSDVVNSVQKRTTKTTNPQETANVLSA